MQIYANELYISNNTTREYFIVMYEHTTNLNITRGELYFN